MSIEFPPGTPTQGNQFTASNDITYIYDGDKWVSIGTIPGTEVVTKITSSDGSITLNPSSGTGSVDISV